MVSKRYYSSAKIHKLTFLVAIRDMFIWVKRIPFWEYSLKILIQNHLGMPFF